MEKVYQKLATPSGYTDYFIWRTQRSAVGEESRAPVLLQSHLLAAEILKRV
jgi:hypothetical protein